MNNQGRRKRPLCCQQSNSVDVTTSRRHGSKAFTLPRQASADPPPKTATVLRLERLLDEDPLQKRNAQAPAKKKRLKKHSQDENVSQVPPPSSSLLLSLSLSSFRAADHRHHSSRPVNVLAFRGGLAAASTFRKAVLSRPKSTNTTTTTTTTTMSTVIATTSSTSEAVPVAQADHTKEHMSTTTISTSTSILPDNVTASAVPETDVVVAFPPSSTSSLRQIGLQLRTKKPRIEFMAPRTNVGNSGMEATNHLEVTLPPPKCQAPSFPPSTTTSPSTFRRVQPTVSVSVSEPPRVPSTLPTKSKLTTTPKTTPSLLPTRPRAKGATSVNDNFVRLNLRNSAGACRGARNPQHRRYRKGYSKYPNNSKNHYWQKRDTNNNDNSDEDDYSDSETKKRFAVQNASGLNHGEAYVSRRTGLDPMDDYLDGVFAPRTTAEKPTQNKPKGKPTTPTKSSSASSSSSCVPSCARHQRTCKLVVVKKNTRGNKGRKFYACSMPHGEQCDHFEWADDTLEVARQVVADNSSHSSFIARQVAAHLDRFRLFTVPELRHETRRRGLDHKTGNKPQLLMRLALWARDEIANAVGSPGHDDHEAAAAAATTTVDMELEESDKNDDEESSSSCSSSSEEELELFGDNDADENSDAEEDENEGSMAENSKDGKSSKLVSTLKSIFGHDRFRDGQEWAIERCLAGKKSLLVAPTGFGKSLCYALPAALMDGVCVVVSPLISLIQVRSV